MTRWQFLPRAAFGRIIQGAFALVFFLAPLALNEKQPSTEYPSRIGVDDEFALLQTTLRTSQPRGSGIRRTSKADEDLLSSELADFQANSFLTKDPTDSHVDIGMEQLTTKRDFGKLIGDLEKEVDDGDALPDVNTLSLQDTARSGGGTPVLASDMQMGADHVLPQYDTMPVKLPVKLPQADAFADLPGADTPLDSTLLERSTASFTESDLDRPPPEWQQGDRQRPRHDLSLLSTSEVDVGNGTDAASAMPQVPEVQSQPADKNLHELIEELEEGLSSVEAKEATWQARPKSEVEQTQYQLLKRSSEEASDVPETLEALETSSRSGQVQNVEAPTREKAAADLQISLSLAAERVHQAVMNARKAVASELNKAAAGQTPAPSAATATLAPGAAPVTMPPNTAETESLNCGDDDQHVSCSTFNRIITLNYKFTVIGGILSWVAIIFITCCGFSILSFICEIAGWLVCIVQVICCFGLAALVMTLYMKWKD